MNRIQHHILGLCVLLLTVVATNLHAQTIRGKIYGGGELATVDGNTEVRVNSGTIGSDTEFDGGVFGGGLGQPTEVTHNVDVKIGKEGAAHNAEGPTIYGDVYGGSALGSVNGTSISAYTTSVTLNAGEVNGSIYGGALGQKNGFNGATSNIEANVYGKVKVNVRGGIVLRRTGDDNGTYSGGIYGCNNLNGSPQTTVEVDIWHHNDAKSGDAYALYAVYGGGNNANYEGGTPKVEVHNCDNSIEYIYGGGNAAHLTHATQGNTNVIIWGCDSIGNVFGGGNGQVQAANVSGNTSVTIHGGKILNVFGGSNTQGAVGGTPNVHVISQGEDENAPCAMDVKNVYGGGNRAAGKSGTIDISCTGSGTIDNVYGGAKEANLEGDITLNIHGGQIGNVFGGNHQSGTIDGAITVNIDWNEGVGACGTNSLGNVYGGGNLAAYTTPDGKQGPTVNLIRGTVSHNVFGGGLGETAVVTGNPKINLLGATVEEDIYGGGDAADVVGTAGVKIDAGVVRNVYGGGNAADVTHTDVVINGGETQMAFAGGHGDKSALPQTEANVTGNASVTIHGGTVGRVFAGSNSKGRIDGIQKVNVIKNAEAQAELHIGEIYGGGNQADGKAGVFEIGCTGGVGEGIGDIFGGAREADIIGDVAFTIQGGNIKRVFGGNNVSGNVTGSIQVNIDEDLDAYDCGLNINYVYGGGQDAAYSPATPGAYPEVNIRGGRIAQDVFGGGLGVTAVVTGNPMVNISGGTVSGNVYGGGALAGVDGSTTVMLTGGSVGGAYGGALGSAEVAAHVNGDTYVLLDGSKVTGDGIFGCNNLNGSPRGHAKVHVLYTTPRDGFEYAVPAVYGGGNLSAYEPSNVNDYAEVLIENCDNSIDYVYGGGNAAPVPATQVKILGANAINHAFAGGNGAGVGNPGADVGYLGYYSSGNSHAYGTGLASIKVLGGTVHNVYGGSNTLGYIHNGTSVSVQNGGGSCSLNVGQVYGGGNEADIDCDVTMDIDCSEGGAVLYAGANNANVYGNIVLNIYSGTYGKVFCGNNQGGNIFGNLTVNIDETGCWPVMIGELYGCGNLAPYSVFGYDSSENLLTEGTRQYADPIVNLISFTRIGKVFGGGFGSTAVLYGNTKVEVNPIKGKFAGQTVAPTYVLDADDNRCMLSEATTLPYGITRNGAGNIVIPDQVGTLGKIYGGGNAGAIYGNTEVNIGTEQKNHHIAGDDTTTMYDVAVIVTGDVYGGGNEASVSGDTNVTIGR